MSLHIALLSDTHNTTGLLRKKNAIPDADVYVFSGDMTGQGRGSELRDWRGEVQRLLDKGKKVVAIAGNHELGVEHNYQKALEIIQPDPGGGFFWLHDSGCEIEGVRFWGSPWTPYFCGWAFNVRAETDLEAERNNYGMPDSNKEISLEARWRMIPANTDVLITHGPPYSILDMTTRGVHAGSRSLLDAVHQTKPQAHVFGHIHEAYGSEVHGSTEFVNASICTKQYAPTNPIHVISISPRS